MFACYATFVGHCHWPPIKVITHFIGVETKFHKYKFLDSKKLHTHGIWISMFENNNQP